MKKLSIILICALVTFLSCTKSKENHPELGDGNEEFITIGAKKVHVKYTRNDIAELQKVMFHYSLAVVQQFHAVEMTKRQEYFDLTLNDLVSDTLYCYYFELYYKGGNTSTTERKTFHTLVMDTPDEPPTPPSSAPEGAINGLFTINENGDQVYFSRGNLQYQASTNSWRFAENQWNCVGGTDYNSGTFFGNVEGSTNNDVAPDYSGWIDLFRWGTSGYDHGAYSYQPWSTSNYFADFYAYGRWNKNLNDDNGQADWGYNCILNGGNQENLWRTMSIQEWRYVIYSRNTTSGARYAKAKVNGVKGLILLPDGWAVPVFTLNSINESESGFDSNEVSLSEWNDVLEPNGAVFLPVTGYRTSIVCWPESEACYFSSSYFNDQRVYHVYIVDPRISVGETEYQCYRYVAEAVRLVQDANR